MNPFDVYTLKARVAPALLLVLPLLLVVYAWLPADLDLAALGIVGACFLAGVIGMAYEVGQAGRRIQKPLFEAWGGAPTAQLLRASNTELSPDAKARFRELLGKHRPDIALPASEAERQEPAAADAIYDKAIGWLQE